MIRRAGATLAYESSIASKHELKDVWLIPEGEGSVGVQVRCAVFEFHSGVSHAWIDVDNLFKQMKMKLRKGSGCLWFQKSHQTLANLEKDLELGPLAY